MEVDHCDAQQAPQHLCPPVAPHGAVACVCVCVRDTRAHMLNSALVWDQSWDDHTHEKGLEY